MYQEAEALLNAIYSARNPSPFLHFSVTVERLARAAEDFVRKVAERDVELAGVVDRILDPHVATEVAIGRDDGTWETRIVPIPGRLQPGLDPDERAIGEIACTQVQAELDREDRVVAFVHYLGLADDDRGGDAR